MVRLQMKEPMSMASITRVGLRVSWRVLVLAWLSTMCVSGATNSPDAQAALFDTARLIEVRIEIAPGDWDALRKEHRDLLAALGPDRLVKPEPKPYRTYRADVIIDGTTIKSVGLQKRGFIGSSSFQRPSLGIKFDAFDAKGEFRGLERVALNNNLQDPSQLHQVLAYRLFARAGVPSPRCNLARVTVNGQVLGIYSHVETVEKSFLESRFNSPKGHLYEGRSSDFRPDWVKTFERKNHKGDTNRSDLMAVVTAFESDDNHLLENLAPLIDLDAYFTYWAVESLIGDWDSYSNNGNNFFIYRHPRSGKFQFIPWGTDAAFGDHDPFTPFETPESVKAQSVLPWRLYRLLETREKYRVKLREVLKTVWDEHELLAEVDHLAALLKGRTHVPPMQFRAAVLNVRDFIRTRRAALEAELDGPAPEWKLPLRPSPCLEKAGTFTADFKAGWFEKRPLNPLAEGSGDFALELNGKKLRFAKQGVFAGPAEDHRNAGHPSVCFIGLAPAGLRMVIPAFVIQPDLFKPGTRIPVDGFCAGGFLLQGALGGEPPRFTGFFLGTLELHEASSAPDGKVTGKLSADLWQMPR